MGERLIGPWTAGIGAAVAMGLLGLLPLPGHAWAETTVAKPVPHVGSPSATGTHERSAIQAARTRRAPEKPAETGNFIYEIINSIQARSKELCARYGSPGDCLEEAEICLTMRDPDDNQIKLCLNTIPGDNDGEGGRPLRSRLRR